MSTRRILNGRAWYAQFVIVRYRTHVALLWKIRIVLEEMMGNGDSSIAVLVCSLSETL
jgi:predicted nuclease of restriction endonuclease-like (RecB) superfamily